MKWTLEKLQKEALKYRSKTEFKKNCSGYQSALKRGLIGQICSHMIPARHCWTDEELKMAASHYSSRSEFELKNIKAYTATLKRNLMDQICAHMRSSITKPYTLQEIMLEAQKYFTRTDFAKNGGGAYNAARKRKDFDKIVAHMDPILARRSLENLKEEALKYQTKSEFYKKNRNAYQIAVKRSDYDQICSHMSNAYNYWDIEKLQKEALRYNSRTTFQKKSKAAYIAAYRKGILEKICIHMEDVHIPSAPEIDLLDTLKTYYPKAQKFKELKIKISDRPYINRFEIDIYIPEFRKGVEFDGTYWHSLEGLKRSHPNWPDEEIEKYHAIKDSYFLSKGIQILHIKEEEWKLNKVDCIQKCLDFLK